MKACMCDGVGLCMVYAECMWECVCVEGMHSVSVGSACGWGMQCCKWSVCGNACGWGYTWCQWRVWVYVDASKWWGVRFLYRSFYHV